MTPLPQLLEEDAEVINAALRGFLAQSEATAAMIAAEGGFLIFHEGDTRKFDATTLAALAANTFNATQAIASILEERNFTSVYQQGETHSLLISQVDKANMLIVVFPGGSSVGVIKYYAAALLDTVARQLNTAREREPGKGIDLALLNLPDSEELFRKKPR